jgi:hypothetical protein
MLLVASIIIFRQLFWNGSLLIFGPERPYSVIIKNKTYLCEKDPNEIKFPPCEIKLLPDDYTFSVRKEGYASAVKNVSILLWQKTDSYLALEKVPNLFVPKEIPVEKSFLFFPEEEKIETFSPYFSLYKDQEETKLFSGELLLTTFPNTTGVLIASDEVGRGVWAITQNNLYFVDIAKQQKASLISGDIENARLLPSGNAIVKKNNKLFLIDPKENSSSPLPESFLDITAICMPDPQNFFVIDQQNGVFSAILWRQEGIQIPLGTLKNFDFQDFVSAECVAPKTILLRFQKDENTRMILF